MTKKEHIKAGNKNPYRTTAKTLEEREGLRSRYERHRSKHNLEAGNLSDKEHQDLS